MRTMLLSLMTLFGLVFGDYFSKRDKLIALEESQMLGSDVVLTEKEHVVNKFLMNYKFLEYDEGFSNPQVFYPSRHFLEVRNAIEQSEVFRFIKRVPKGGNLHVHVSALLSFDALYNLTYEENLYACTVSGKLRLKFMSQAIEDEKCKWQLLKSLRDQNSSYDTWLKSQLVLSTENNMDINAVWQTFENVFETVSPMIRYRPVLEKYVYQALRELYEDNVFYLEFRVNPSKVYELDGYVHNYLEVVSIYEKVIKKFKKDYQKFFDARLIYSRHRTLDKASAKKWVEAVHAVKTQHPNFLVGVDLVGQEDLGKPLKEFITTIKRLSKITNVILHAGETNWFGTLSDFNLIDAILLGAKRIGHGYALTKHPILMSLVRKRKIPVEICPISNQVLLLVKDLRNHPAAEMIARGYPVVVCSDDPSVWNAKGLSYDFYLTFMGIASRSSDLRLLKKLAENSLTYSALSETDKIVALKKWHEQWNDFIATMYVEIKKKSS